MFSSKEWAADEAAAILAQKHWPHSGEEWVGEKAYTTYSSRTFVSSRGNVYPALQPPNVISEPATHNRPLNKGSTDVTLAELVFFVKIIFKNNQIITFLFELYVAIGNQIVIVRTISLYNRIIRIIVLWDLLFKYRILLKTSVSHLVLRKILIWLNKITW